MLFGFDIPDPEDPFIPPQIPEKLLRPPLKWDRPIWPIRWGPARIKILVVTDGANYEDDGFSLSIALEAAFDPSHPEHPSYARFEFTRATHEQQYPFDYNPDPGWNGIRLTADKLQGFDQLWLFGVKTGAPYLQPDEVTAIHAFMDNGGGVLAMGDHEDLGLGLCGQVQRVRSMRKWWYTSPSPPAGMLQAPDGTNLTRNDTVQAPTPGADVNTGTQSDPTPQPIYPNWRYAPYFWSPWRRVRYPHPILCGPRGAIRVMPDHAHEGDCIIPDGAFAGEYPDGVPVEVIARGRNVVGRSKAGGNVIVDDRAFGLIGVWDGHQASGNKGRVVVDSTWHHWFNINLYGLEAENGDEWRDVLAYFRNVAVWLASKGQQAAMRRAGTLIWLLSPAMIEEVLTLKDWRIDRFYPIGVYARDALGRLAPRCQTLAWFAIWLEAALPLRIAKSLAAEVEEQPDNPLARARLDLVMGTTLGAIVNSLAIALNERGFDKLEAVADDLDGLVARGGEMAVKALSEQFGSDLGRYLDRKAETAE